MRTGTWSLLAKTAAAANLFLTVPFVLQALGPAQFGVWATLVALVTFAAFLDFGLGNGTMNLIADAHGRGAREELGSIFHEGRRTLLRISFWLGGAALIALPLIPWTRLLGLPDAMAAEVRNAVAAVLLSIIVAAPLNLATRVQLGLARGDIAFKWQMLGQLMAATLVVALASWGAGLASLVTASVATPLVASAANTWVLSRDPELKSGRREKRRDVATRIRREGLLFFVLQISAALAFSSDLPLISILRGPEDAGSYAIVQRLFSIVPLSLGLIWVPLWPIYRQALAAGDYRWASRTLRRSLWLAITTSSCAAALLFLYFGQITAIWLQAPLAISATLIAGYSIWCVIDSVGSAVGTFLNAASILRFQVIVGASFAALCFTAKVWVLTELGVEALPWVTATTFGLFTLLPVWLYWQRLKQTAFGKAA